MSRSALKYGLTLSVGDDRSGRKACYGARYCHHKMNTTRTMAIPVGPAEINIAKRMVGTSQRRAEILDF